MIDQFDGDVAYILTPDGGQIIYQGGQSIMDAGGLENAVNISLFTDLGYWANALNENEPDKQIGSDFEERIRPKAITTAYLRDVEDAALDALQWMINQKIAQTVEARAVWPELNRVDLEILITKPSGDIVTIRYELNWEAGLLYPVTAKVAEAPTEFDDFFFTTTDQTFDGKIVVTGNPNITWFWSDGTTDTIADPPLKDFGSVAIRVHRLRVTTWRTIEMDAWHTVTELDWHNQDIEFDITNLSRLTNLVVLSLYGTSVSGDIANLSGLTGLTYLDLYGISVSGDIANLSGLTGLTYLDLYSTSVSGDIINLSDLTNLTYLHLGGISVSGDIANLSGLTNLVVLSLGGISVSGDIANLSGLTGLTYLHLGGTSVDTYTQGVLPNWDACNIYIQGLGLSQQEVDDFLCDLDTASSASTKALNIGGTNSAPSATGLVCKTSLEGKGWTVTTS